MSPEDTGRWLLAIAKHLKVFAQDARLAALYATRQAATDGELLLRLRGARSVSLTRLRGMAFDVGIAPQQLRTTVARLETTGLIEAIGTLGGGELQGVREAIFTEAEIYRAIAALFEAADPEPAERAMVPLLDLLSKLPLSEDEVIERVSRLGFTEPDIRRALELQDAFGLVRRQRVTDMGIVLLHNEYLWGHKIARIGPLLATMRQREADALLALMEEVRGAQGRSVDQLTSVSPHIVTMATQTGILDTTTIVTAAGDRKIFAFSPHFYGYRAGPQSTLLDDHADQIKLFVASIGYGVHHSIDFRLRAPIEFVQKLLRTGEAGDATPILRDYGLLERHGIVRVEERTPGRGTFILQQRDVVERALDVMANGSLLTGERGLNDVRSLVTQQHFNPPEVNRLQAILGHQAGETRQLNQDLLAAIREAAQGGTWE